MCFSPLSTSAASQCSTEISDNYGEELLTLHQFDLAQCHKKYVHSNHPNLRSRPPSSPVSVPMRTYKVNSNQEAIEKCGCMTDYKSRMLSDTPKFSSLHQTKIDCIEQDLQSVFKSANMKAAIFMQTCGPQLEHSHCQDRRTPCSAGPSTEAELWHLTGRSCPSACIQPNTTDTAPNATTDGGRPWHRRPSLPPSKPGPAHPSLTRGGRRPLTVGPLGSAESTAVHGKVSDASCRRGWSLARAAWAMAAALPCVSLRGVEGETV
jgi:hypothetical protein